MRDLLQRHPLLISLVAVLLVAAVAGILILPRLDGVEIRAATWADGGDPHELEVEVAFRLASAPVASLSVIALAPGGERRERVRVTRGRGERTILVKAPKGRHLLVVAELMPAGGEAGLLDVLQRNRRRDALRVAPDCPHRGSALSIGRRGERQAHPD